MWFIIFGFFAFMQWAENATQPSQPVSCNTFLYTEFAPEGGGFPIGSWYLCENGSTAFLPQ